MGKIVKNYKKFVNESEVAEPQIKPTVKPGTKTPNRRQSPIRRDKPSVKPGPKASAEDVADKFLGLVSGNKRIMSLLNKKYK